MATFVVTTGEDVVNANDGVLSLREAIAAAQSQGGADTITFGDDIDSDVVKLASTLKIEGGSDVTIDGTTTAVFSRIQIDGGFRGNIEATGFTMIEIAGGASLKLRNLDMANGFERGIAGIDGVSGDDGLDGTDGDAVTPDKGVPGSNGNGGTGGFSAINDGRMAVGGIENRGNLTIELASVGSMNAFGGLGGNGGDGGNGGKGGKGDRNEDGTGGIGGSGGPAASGGNGTSGGDAAGAIYNLGTLTLIDADLSGHAYGGNGGEGGQGGGGGAGGKGGASSTGKGASGGFGGAGGSSGISGNGGDAASVIFNQGTIVSEGTTATFTGTEAAGVSKLIGGGAGGAGGAGAGLGTLKGADGKSGPAGQAGIKGTDGIKAGDNHILGDDGNLVFATNTFVVETVSQSVDEGGLMQFLIRRLGDTMVDSSVDWSINGLGAADFADTQALSGTVQFSAFDAFQIVSIQTRDDGKAEGDETFTIDLGETSDNAALGVHRSLEVTIDDTAAVNLPPTHPSLSAILVSDKARAGTVVGKLSAEDPDGDNVTFTITNNPGGFFDIVDDRLVLAKAINPAKHSYSIIVEASDGHGGVAPAAFVIRLKGYIDGDSAANTLTGSKQSDHLFGYAGKDVLKGLAGDDFLIGGRDADKLYGDEGREHFVFMTANDSTGSSDGRDTIFQFDGKNGDRIDLTALASESDGSLDFIGKQKFHKEAGEFRYDVKQGDATLYGDLDGNGEAEFSVLIKGAGNLKEEWLDM